MKKIILSMRVGLIDDLSVTLYMYHFVRTILSIPFCPIPFCPYTILSIPFCPYHFVRYHFVLEPYEALATSFSSLRLMTMGSQSSPSPSHLPTNSVWAVYS